MNWKVDENLPSEIVEDLRLAGHDADSVFSEGLAGKDDRAVADAACAAGRVLVTLDKELGDIRQYPPSQHAGVVLMRLSKEGRTTAREAIQRALPILAAQGLSGRLAIVTETTVRFRT